jgi:hypothetical protein
MASEKTIGRKRPCECHCKEDPENKSHNAKIAKDNYTKKHGIPVTYHSNVVSENDISALTNDKFREEVSSMRHTKMSFDISFSSGPNITVTETDIYDILKQEKNASINVVTFGDSLVAGGWYLYGGTGKYETLCRKSKPLFTSLNMSSLFPIFDCDKVLLTPATPIENMGESEVNIITVPLPYILNSMIEYDDNHIYQLMCAAFSIHDEYKSKINTNDKSKVLIIDEPLFQRFGIDINSFIRVMLIALKDKITYLEQYKIIISVQDRTLYNNYFEN